MILNAQARRRKEYDQRHGGYHVLLARVFERWVLDAQGRITDYREHNIQPHALKALMDSGSTELLVVKMAAQETGKKPEDILAALREQVMHECS